MNPKALHPLGGWYHVASVYDGREFRNYVDGIQEGSAQLHLAPHGAGHSSVGMRINKLFYFKGAVHLARFTHRALSPSEFLMPPALRRATPDWRGCNRIPATVAGLSIAPRQLIPVRPCNPV